MSDSFVDPEERIFTLPPDYRPEKAMLHALIPLFGDREPVAVCRVMPNGEVFRFKGATLEDIAKILMDHYHVNFKQLADIWFLEDAGHEPDEG
jgi:hypothetical protein